MTRLPGRCFHPILVKVTAMLILTGHFSLAEILLEDDFSGNLSDNWMLFGDPQPFICDTLGLPAPCFDNNGDAHYNSGVFSKISWSSSNGLVLECDMYVTSNERGAWISGMIGLDYSLEDQCEEGSNPADISLAYCYCGEADWACPHLQGSLYAVVRFPDGSKDNVSFNHFNEFLDSWNRFKIVIELDRTISFYVDNVLVHETEFALPPDLGALSVVLGLRSNEWGRVYHDNLVLRTF